MTSRVTIFKNIKETETPFHREINVVLQRIKDGATKNLVKDIRTTKDKTERNELKRIETYSNKVYRLFVLVVSLINVTTMQSLSIAVSSA